ncbi:glycosyltransferase [Candidatus Dojkabacteria bacterium]|nr:glycosyltransferase [Candidatus Dojkabacteria bacterium]
MKTVFTTTFTGQQGGGLARIAYEISEQFAKNIGPTAIIHPGDKQEIYTDEKGLVHCTILSTDSTDPDYSQPSFTQENIAFLDSFLKKFNPDVIHAHDPVNISLIGQIWAINNNVPFFYTTHILPDKVLDFRSVTVMPEVFMHAIKPISNQYMKRFLNNCTAVVALNKAAITSNINVGIKRETIEVIPNGRDLSLYDQCKIADISSKDKFICFIGTIIERKNQEFLIKALKYLPENYKLILIGSTASKEYINKLKELMTKDLEQRVIFTGQLDYKKVIKPLEQAHVFASAAKMEVQSLVIIEALASKTPVVGISNETVDEFIDSSVGIAHSKDVTPKEFAKSIEKICTLPKYEYEKLCLNSRDKVKHLDWSIIVNQTLNMYKKHIKNGHFFSLEEKRNRIQELLDTMPIGQSKILKQIHNLIEHNTFSNSAKNKQKYKIPLSTYIFAGGTILASVLIYFGWRSRKKLKEFSSKKK